MLTCFQLDPKKEKPVDIVILIKNKRHLEWCLQHSSLCGYMDIVQMRNCAVWLDQHLTEANNCTHDFVNCYCSSFYFWLWHHCNVYGYDIVAKYISAICSWASYQIRKIAVCACAWNAGSVFPTTDLKGKPLVNDPDMHHGTCVTDVPWCMSGSLTPRGGENVPGIPGACATRSFAYLARGPFNVVYPLSSESRMLGICVVYTVLG